MIQIAAPAKINLFLQVVGKRADGYHELVTLMCPIGLADDVRLELRPNAIHVTCSNPAVPADASNTAFRAAEIFFQRLTQNRSTRFMGVEINIVKAIPVGAGLGGGSSDAAAVINGLNRCLGHPFKLEELFDLGLKVGADVPFFILGQPAIATGVGEQLQPYRKLVPYTVLLLYPGVAVSTAEVYKNLDLGLTNCEKKLKDFVLKHQPFDAAVHLCNDLETVTLSRFPQVMAAKKAVSKCGARGALMAGSGSAVFGLFDDRHTACRAMDRLKGSNGWSLFLTELIIDAGESRPTY